MRYRALAIATRIMLDQPKQRGPFTFSETYAIAHKVASKVYEVMHAENERLLNEATSCGCDGLHPYERTTSDGDDEYPENGSRP